MAWNLEKPKFKVGDLVRIKETIKFIFGEAVVHEGDIGLVIDSEIDNETDISLWGFDYSVLLKSGITFVFFESELELIEPIKKQIKFVFLKN